MKNAIGSLSVLLILLIVGCGQAGSNKQLINGAEDGSLRQYIYLTASQLQMLGVFIKDSSVMYNNSIEGVGSLNITIRDREYYGDIATIEQTALNFYPRYITTLDTIQRTMYRLRGDQSHSLEEAQKWEQFESLVPIVVDQIDGEMRFGETLVFWYTRTPELEKLITEMEK